MTPEPAITIVIPALGNAAVLARVLDGYARQPPGHPFEVIVVIDAADPDPDAIRRTVGVRPYPTRVLIGSVPGASANRNVGWRAARHELVLFTDSDTTPTSSLVAEHIAWHERHPEPQAVVVGRVRWARGIKVTPFMRWLEQGVQFDFDGIRGTEASWAHVYSANCSVKREFIARVGGYDEDRFPYGYEDLDWGYRAREHGLTVLYNRDAVVEHWRTMTVEQWRARAPRLAVSEWRFCARHPDVPAHFHRLFAEAAAHPPGGRRSAHAAHLIPRTTPWLGPRVWARATLHWRQQIAPPFLAAWNAAAAGTPPPLEPAQAAVRERAFWDERAREDAYFFVDDRREYRDARTGRFWSDGERDLDRLLSILDLTIEPDHTVVDIGCGVGRLTRAIAAHAVRVYAIDVSSEMVSRAQGANAALENVDWLVGDGRTLWPLGDGSVDACISHVVFQHIPDPEVTLSYVVEMGRVLRAGGWAAFQVSNDPQVHVPRHGIRAAQRRLAARVGRAPRGQDEPAWLGSAVTLDAIRTVAGRSGLEVERVVGAGTQFCVIRVRKLPPAPRARPG